MKARRDLAALALLTAFSLLVYLEIFRYNSFGPEFPLYYFYTPRMPIREMLRAYTYLDQMWYRPTATTPLYWLGQYLMSWHNLAAWKSYYFLTILATGGAIYWFVLLLLPRQRASAFLAAAYFVAQPSLYALAMDVSSFDCIHILFSVLCAAFYIRGNTVLAWLCFIAAITSKETALALPLYLLVVGQTIAFRRLSRRAALRREALRLLPFFATLALYYFLHIAKIPATTFTASGPYRAGLNWEMILRNLRKFPLWVMRIYCFTGETLQQRMYMSSFLNNTAGLIVFAAVAAWWARNLKRDKSYILPFVAGLGWMVVFLLIPIYSGLYFWHINLAIPGYAVLFGIATAHYWSALPRARLRAIAAAVFLLGWVALCRANMHVELYSGTHATGFLINHALLPSPPVPAAQLGDYPLIYIEDRLGMGAWWYGCYGKLFNFVYLRRDIEEQIFPGMQAVPAAAREKWLARPHAYYLRYDNEYEWHDASADFRRAVTSIAVRPLPPFPIRVVAGGSRTVDSAGHDWGDDRGYDGGDIYRTPNTIAGTDSPELYRTERFNKVPFQYRFDVPNGQYTARLKFAEIWPIQPGGRLFDVTINGARVLHHFDIAAEAGGPYRAIDKAFPVKVTGGSIVIRFEPVVGDAKVSAIEIT